MCNEDCFNCPYPDCIKGSDTEKESERKFMRKKYELRKRNGLCVRCGSKPRGETLMCEECREKVRIAGEKERRKPDKYKQMLQYCQSRYHRLKMEGLCVQCGKTEATNGILCQRCYDRAVENRRKAKEKK